MRASAAGVKIWLCVGRVVVVAAVAHVALRQRDERGETTWLYRLA